MSKLGKERIIPNTPDDREFNKKRREFIKNMSLGIIGTVTFGGMIYSAHLLGERPSYFPGKKAPGTDFISYLDFRSSIFEMTRSHLDLLKEVSKKYGVPVELIMGTIYSEMFVQNELTEFGDNLKLFTRGLGFRADPSIGFGQMRVETALELNHKFNIERSEKETMDQLMNIEGAIKYIAMYYNKIASVLKIGDLNKIEIIGDPYNMVYLYGTYIGGPHPNISAITNGLGIIGILKEIDTDIPQLPMGYEKSCESLFLASGEYYSEGVGLTKIYNEFSDQIAIFFDTKHPEKYKTSILGHLFGKDIVPSNLEGVTYEEKRQNLLDRIKNASSISTVKYNNYITSLHEHGMCPKCKKRTFRSIKSRKLCNSK